MRGQISESVRIYIARVARFPLYDLETQIALHKEWKGNGSYSAYLKLLQSQLRLVVQIALEYNFGVLPLDDLIAEGNVGLIISIERFDSTRGVKLNTYSPYWIRATIHEALLRNKHMVRLGLGQMQILLLRNFNRLYDAFIGGGRTHEEFEAYLAARFGNSLKTVRATLNVVMLPDVSVHARERVSGEEHLERMPSSDTPADERLWRERRNKSVRDRIRMLLPELNTREKLILRKRLFTDRPQTLARIGRTLGLSRERVRQLEEKLKRKLRHAFVDLGSDDERTGEAA